MRVQAAKRRPGGAPNGMGGAAQPGQTMNAARRMPALAPRTPRRADSPARRFRWIFSVRSRSCSHSLLRCTPLARASPEFSHAARFSRKVPAMPESRFSALSLCPLRRPFEYFPLLHGQFFARLCGRAQQPSASRILQVCGALGRPGRLAALVELSSLDLRLFRALPESQEASRADALRRRDSRGRADFFPAYAE